MNSKRLWIGAGALGLMAVAGAVVANVFLAGAFVEGPSAGPFDADGRCPSFEARYPSCEVRFGNRGLSTLNSLYETFVGQGAFEISSFAVESRPGGRFDITAQSNRGPIRSEITADRVVRLGQDREDEVVRRTSQSAYCEAGRIYEHQVVYLDGSVMVQHLEFWSEGGQLRFRLFQNGSPTADVACKP